MCAGSQSDPSPADLPIPLEWGERDSLINSNDDVSLRARWRASRDARRTLPRANCACSVANNRF